MTDYITTHEDYESVCMATRRHDEDRTDYHRIKHESFNGDHNNVITLGGPFGWPVLFCRQPSGDWRVGAGCRWFTLEQAHAHWTERRDNRPPGSTTGKRARGMISLLHFFEDHVQDWER